MKKVFKYYFSDRKIISYWLIAVMLLVFLIYSEFIQSYWWTFFVIITIAPIYEWLTHKYILHHVNYYKEYFIDNSLEQFKINDKIQFEFNNKIFYSEIHRIENSKAIIGIYLAKYDFFRTLFGETHYWHHKDPNNINHIFAPFKLIVFGSYFEIFLVGIGFGTLFTQSINLPSALCFLFFGMIYYNYYEWVHLSHHVNEFIPKISCFAKLKRMHSLHHFRDEHYWWGITNPFADYILGTNKEISKVKISPTCKNINPMIELNIKNIITLNNKKLI